MQRVQLCKFPGSRGSQRRPLRGVTSILRENIRTSAKIADGFPSEQLISQRAYYKLLWTLIKELVGDDLEGRDEIRETCIECKSRRNLLMRGQ